ncbi:hypothetical protein BDZ45DRAFT_803913 [Acephala macrosclerotiorum]|nr:hypothetical protein BDZ45DRAFT_803913 [Acephala macrosclerotiorum]
MTKFDLGVGDPVAATSLVLQLITGLQNNEVLEKFSEEMPVYYAVLVEVKDLMAGSPHALPASARAALDLCERRQARLLEFVQENKDSNRLGEKIREFRSVGIFGTFSYKNKGKLWNEEFERRFDMWKGSVKLLRELTVHSITLCLLHQGPLDSQSVCHSVLPPSGSITADRASIGVTIAGAIVNGEQSWVPAKGLLDTQAQGKDNNWVTKRIVERAGLLDKIRPIDGKGSTFTDFEGIVHKVQSQIRLTWFPIRMDETRDTNFFVSEKGSFDILFGQEFMDGYAPARNTLPILYRPGSPYEEAQKNAIAERKRREARAATDQQDAEYARKWDSEHGGGTQS